MEIILLEKIANLGDLGGIVNVRSGFGRNYLIPQGKAKMATKATLLINSVINNITKINIAVTANTLNPLLSAMIFPIISIIPA